MNYDPLTDPAADGFVDLSQLPAKEDWKEPLWAKFKNWVKGTSAAVVVVALFLLGVVLWLKPKPALQSEPVTMTIEATPQAARTLPAPKRPKNATEKIARQAINTPAMPSFEAAKPIKKESSTDDPLTPALAEFDKQVINFESNL